MSGYFKYRRIIVYDQYISINKHSKKNNGNRPVAGLANFLNYQPDIINPVTYNILVMYIILTCIIYIARYYCYS